MNQKEFTLLPQSRIGEIFVSLDVIGRISSIYLISEEDNSAIRLMNQMVDISERLEVGTLVETAASTPDASSGITIGFGDERLEATDWLIRRVGDDTYVSGVSFGGSACGKLDIVAADFPFTLTLSSLGLRSTAESEIDLSDYDRVPIM